MPSYLYRTFGMNLSMAGFNATAYLQTASVLGVLTGGVLADWLSRRRRGARAFTQSLGLTCGIPFLFLIGHARATPLLIIAMACFGYFKGLYDANIFASLYDVVSRRAARRRRRPDQLAWLAGRRFRPGGGGRGLRAHRHERLPQRHFRHLPLLRRAAGHGRALLA